ncbi:unnamed protein product [Gemmata massiliana]|uniref:Uncharacterized protein n=1 Tax=Gemmata massiliana TaxID=1210884 RepID=A0A6P2D3V2_9BACT|nr:hypothetical protein [Gemmata massiliana]VTR94132.1 unnamed protein product [Gemmata massiliana]
MSTLPWNAYDYMGRTKFNRDLLELVKLAQQLRERVAAFVEYDTESVTEDLIALGIPPEILNSRTTKALLNNVEDVARDIGGFTWALDMFKHNTDMDAIPMTESELAEPVPGATGEAGDNAAPCAVVGGKAGA